MKKRILVLHATYGNGHKAIANYIENYFKNKDEDIEILNLDILQYSGPFLGKATKVISEFLMMKQPYLWDLIYKLADNKVNATITEKASLQFLKNKRLMKEIVNFNPDLTICTHFFCSSLIAEYNKKQLLNSKIITIITDYTSHEMWINSLKDMDYLIVSCNEEKRYLAKKKYVSKDKIKAYGIPIFPKVDNNFNKKKILSSLGLSFDKQTCVFFAGGGNGYSNTLPYIKRLLKKQIPLNFIFIAGRNKKVENKIKEYIKRYDMVNCKVYGYATNVPELLKVSDFVVTKPGGIQSTECLYFKKPMLLLRVISGCEYENMKYLVSKGYAKSFRFIYTFANFVEKIAINPKTLNKFNKQLNKMNNQEAMDKIYKLSIKILNK